MKVASCFIEPLDVLFLRGNKLFGDPGSFGESLVPPWPSVAAGALRSRILADEAVDLDAFAGNKVIHPALGTPDEPGSFVVSAFLLARRRADGRIEALMAPPADLAIDDEGRSPVVRRLTPTPIAAGISASNPLPMLPVLAEQRRGKQHAGYWLTEAGWKRYLRGETPIAHELIDSASLWTIDHRVGVGLDTDTRRAADGKLFSMQAVSMAKREHAGKNGFDVGFLACATGATLPTTGIVRLGGDGRAAAIQAVQYTPPEADYTAICRARRARLVLTSPGIFTAGWLPVGADTEARFNLWGVSGRLVCAAVPRPSTVSGWDLARRRPKAAHRVAPSGSVYWLDELDATPEALRKLAEAGLWSHPCEDVHRRAEGFNRIAIAAF